MITELQERENTALALSESVRLMPVLSTNEFKQQLKALQEIVGEYLTKDVDYGKQPGTDKDTLFKSGAEKLSEIYAMRPEYEIVDSTQDFDEGLFKYTIKCVLIDKRNGSQRGEGIASCNSYESKYRYRKGTRKCPDCGKEAIIKGKAEYGGGWLCWQKKEGCGAKWADGASEIEGQSVDRVENENLADTDNTILKMAKKRALVDAVVSTTRSSGIFTMDIEDFIDAEIKVVKEPVTVQSVDKETGEVTLGEPQKSSTGVTHTQTSTNPTPATGTHQKTATPSTATASGAPLPYDRVVAAALNVGFSEDDIRMIIKAKTKVVAPIDLTEEQANKLIGLIADGILKAHD
jgi:hypothetical protein